MTPSLMKVLNLREKLCSSGSDLGNQLSKTYFSILYKLKFNYQARTQNYIVLATHYLVLCYFQLKCISRSEKSETMVLK